MKLKAEPPSSNTSNPTRFGGLSWLLAEAHVATSQNERAKRMSGLVQ